MIDIAIAERYRPMLKKLAEENMKIAEGGDRKSEKYQFQGWQKSAKVPKPIHTRDELAKIAGVGHDNRVRRNLQTLLKKSSTPLKSQTLGIFKSGSFSVTEFYDLAMDLAANFDGQIFLFYFFFLDISYLLTLVTVIT